MKKFIILLIFCFFKLCMFYYAHPSYGDWQSTLESKFKIVETFDNLQDWVGIRNGYSWDLATMPKKIDGSPSLWNYFDIAGDVLPGQGEENIKMITNHGEYSLGNKSLCMTYTNFCEMFQAFPSRKYDRSIVYGPYRMAIFFGTPGNDTSGYREIHIFYMMKFSFNEYSLTGGDYIWIKSKGGTDEYYLNYPGQICANTLTINGTRIPHRSMGTLGSLNYNSWGYGDNDNLGYYTLYVRLSGNTIEERNPKNKTKNYINYESGFFSLSDRNSPSFYYGANAKHMLVNAGFWNHNWWHDDNGDNGCQAQNKQGYGCNFQIFNWYGNTSNLWLADQVNVATLSNNCYNYDRGKDATGSIIDGRPWQLEKSDANIIDWYVNKKWIGMEYRLKIGTEGNCDGETEVWVYDEDGNVKFHQLRTGDNHLKIFADHKYNRIEFGGNRINSGYQFDNGDSWDNRWYLDDVIIDFNNRIGPTYFALRNHVSKPKGGLK